MSETVQHDKWLNDYLGLVVPPQPRPPQALGAKLDDVEALQTMAKQLKTYQLELTKLARRENAELESLNLLADMMGDEFGQMIDRVEGDDTIENRAEICETLEKDRFTLVDPFSGIASYEASRMFPVSFSIAVTKILESMRASVAAGDDLRAEQGELLRRKIPELVLSIKPYTTNPVDGIARTARALVASTEYGQPAASTAALDTMIDSRKETPVVNWIDSAEKDKFHSAEATGSAKESADAIQGMPEEEKQRIRDDYEQSLKDMGASQLQSIIDYPSALKESFESYYADDEGKGRVAKWTSGLVKLAQQLLPNAPEDPAPPSDEEIARLEAEARKQHRMQRREERDAVRGDGSTDPEEQPVGEIVFERLERVVKKINEHGERILALSAQIEAQRADIREGAKFVAGNLRIMIGSGLEGVPPPRLEETTQGIRAVEAAFTLIANGSFDKVPANLPDLAALVRRSGLAIDPSVIVRAQETLRDMRRLDPSSPNYDPRREWEELVDQHGTLAQRARDPLLDDLQNAKTKNPKYEKMRGRIENVLFYPASDLKFPLQALEPLRVGKKP